MRGNRNPFTVHRPPPVTLHDKQSTLTRPTPSAEMDTPIASSQKPEAILRVTPKAVYRNPFTDYRPPSVTSHDKQSTLTRPTLSTEMDTPIASSRKPEASSDLAPAETAKQPSSLFKPFQALSSPSSLFKPFKPFQAFQAFNPISPISSKRAAQSRASFFATI